MRYEKYEQRMLKLNKFLNWIYRLRFVLIGAAVFGAIATMTVLSIKGQIQVTYDFKETYEYGEVFEPTGSALMNSVKYQYRRADSDEWQEERPIDAGQYVSRAYSYNGFGMKTYGEEQTFAIAQKALDVSIKDTNAIYGEKLAIAGEGLIIGDTIANYSYSFGENYYTDHPFGDKASFTTKVNVSPEDFKITNSEGEDKTLNYIINYNEKEVSISKRKLTITTGSASKTYDRGALKKEDFTVTSSSLAEGDELSVSSYSSITLPGTSKNSASGVSIKNGKYNRTDFYDLTVNEGSLTINPISITLKSNNVTREYNSNRVTNELKVSTVGGTILDGHTLEVTFDHPEVYIGNYTNSFTYHIYDENNEDVSSTLYNVSVEYGDIKISKRPLTISAQSGTKKYDGTPLTSNLAYGEVAEHDTLIVNPDEDYTITDPGSIDYSYTFSITNNNELGWTNYNDVYNVSTINTMGTLEVEKLNIYLDKPSFNSRAYNGKKIQEKDIYYDIYGDIDELARLGYHPELTINPSIYDVYFAPTGADIAYTFKVVDGDGNEAPSSILTIHDDGIYNKAYITKATLNVSFADKTYKYDGNPHVAYDAPYSVTGLASTDSYSYTPASSYTDPTTLYCNDIVITTHNDDLDVVSTAYYNISVSYPTLTINKRNITLTSNSLTRNYNGDVVHASELGEVTVSGDGFIEGDELSDVTYSAVVNPTYIAENGIYNTFDYSIKRGGADFAYSDYYNITIVRGTITIRKINLSITFKSKTVVYDGTEHTLFDDDDVTYPDLVAGDSLTFRSSEEFAKHVNYSSSPYQTSLPSLNIQISNSILGSNAKNGYNLSVATPSLRINQREITINVNNAFDGNKSSIYYDGYSHDVYDTDITCTNLADGDVLVGLYDDGDNYYDLTTAGVIMERKEAGSYNMLFDNKEFRIRNNDGTGEDVTSNYKLKNNRINVVAPNARIDARPIKIVTPSYDEVYDGLTYNYNGRLGEISIKENDSNFLPLADNEEITAYTYTCDLYGYYQSTYSSGTKNNTLVDSSIVIKHYNPSTDTYDDVDVYRNYNISYELGTIDVRRRAVTVTYVSPESRVYDGSTDSYGLGYTDKGYSITSGSLGNGDIDSPTEFYSFTYVADSIKTNFSTGFEVTHGGVDVTFCYNVTLVKGSVVITPRPIDIHIDISLDDDDSSVYSITYDDEYHNITGSDFEITTRPGEAESGRVGTDYLYSVSYHNEDDKYSYQKHTFFIAYNVVTRKYYKEGGYLFDPIDIVIYNADGEDITSSYSYAKENFILINEGKTEIKQRDVKVYVDYTLNYNDTKTDVITYDSVNRPFYSDSITWEEEGADRGLLDTHQLYYVYTKEANYNILSHTAHERLYAGTYKFEPTNALIGIKDDVYSDSISSSYKVEYVYTKIDDKAIDKVTINKRDVYIRIEYALDSTLDNPYSILYDGKEYVFSNDNIFVEADPLKEDSGLAVNDQLCYIRYSNNSGNTYDNYFFRNSAATLIRRDAADYYFKTVKDQIYLGDSMYNYNYDITRSYNITVKEYTSKVTISKRTLNIKVDTSLTTENPDSIIYDSYYHNITESDFTYSGDGFAENEKPDYMYYSNNLYSFINSSDPDVDPVIIERINYKSSTYDFTLYNSNFHIKHTDEYNSHMFESTQNYTINVTVTYEHVRINIRDLVMKYSDLAIDYDGLEHHVLEYTFDNGTTLADNDIISEEYLSEAYYSYTNSGTYARAGYGGNSSSHLLNSNNFLRRNDSSFNDVSSNYRLTVSNVTLTINKKAITLVNKDGAIDHYEMNYNGNFVYEQEGQDFSSIVGVSNDTPISDESVKEFYQLVGYYEYEDETGEVIDYDHYFYPTSDFIKITFRYKVTRAGTDASSNYIITDATDLYYKINPVPVVIQNNVTEMGYSGEEFTNFNSLLSVYGLPYRYSYSGLNPKLDRTAIDLGDYTISYNANITIYDNHGNQVADGFFTIDDSTVNPIFSIVPLVLDYYGGLTPSLSFTGDEITAADIINNRIDHSSLLAYHEIRDKGLFTLKEAGETYSALIYDAIYIVDTRTGEDVTSRYGLPAYDDDDNYFFDHPITFTVGYVHISNPGYIASTYYSGYASYSDSLVERGNDPENPGRGIAYWVDVYHDGRFKAEIVYPDDSIIENSFYGKIDAGEYLKTVRIYIYDTQTDENVSRNFSISSYYIRGDEGEEYLQLEKNPNPDPEHPNDRYYKYTIKQCVVTVRTDPDRIIAYDGEYHLVDYHYNSQYDHEVIYDAVSFDNTSVPKGLQLEFIYSGETGQKYVGEYDSNVFILVRVDEDDNYELLTLNDETGIDLGNFRVKWVGSSSIHTIIRQRIINVAIFTNQGKNKATRYISNYYLINEVIYPEKVIVSGKDKTIASSDTLYIGEEIYNINQTTYAAIEDFDDTTYNINIADFHLLENIHIYDSNHEDVTNQYSLSQSFTNGVTILNVIREE